TLEELRGCALHGIQELRRESLPLEIVLCCDDFVWNAGWCRQVRGLPRLLLATGAKLPELRKSIQEFIVDPRRVRSEHLGASVREAEVSSPRRGEQPGLLQVRASPAHAAGEHEGPTAWKQSRTLLLAQLELVRENARSLRRGDFTSPSLRG